MTRRTEAAARRLLGVVLAAAAGANGGCVAYEVVATPVKVAADAVVVTGKTASAAVKATGRVAVSAFDAAGRVGSGGIDSVSKLATTGMVTFVDVGSGAVVRVPWRTGATLVSAGADARVRLAERAIDVVRRGAIVYSARRFDGRAAVVAGGDVVRIRG